DFVTIRCPALRFRARAFELGELLGGPFPIRLERRDSLTYLAVVPYRLADVLAAVHIELRIGEKLLEAAELSGLAFEVPLDATHSVAMLLAHRPLPSRLTAPLLRRLNIVGRGLAPANTAGRSLLSCILPFLVLPVQVELVVALVGTHPAGVDLEDSIGHRT